MTGSDWKWEKNGRLLKEMYNVKIDLKEPLKHCWDIASGYTSTGYKNDKVAGQRYCCQKI